MSGRQDGPRVLAKDVLVAGKCRARRRIIEDNAFLRVRGVQDKRLR
jgi:hypothetical protein